MMTEIKTSPNKKYSPFHIKLILGTLLTTSITLIGIAFAMACECANLTCVEDSLSTVLSASVATLLIATGLLPLIPWITIGWRGTDLVNAGSLCAVCGCLTLMMGIFATYAIHIQNDPSYPFLRHGGLLMGACLLANGLWTGTRFSAAFRTMHEKRRHIVLSLLLLQFLASGFFISVGRVVARTLLRQ